MVVFLIIVSILLGEASGFGLVILVQHLLPPVVSYREGLPPILVFVASGVGLVIAIWYGFFGYIILTSKRK